MPAPAVPIFNPSARKARRLLISGAFFLFIGVYTITLVLIWTPRDLSFPLFISPLLSAVLGFVLGAMGLFFRTQASRLRAASDQMAKGDCLAHWIHPPAAWEHLVKQRQAQRLKRIHTGFLAMAGAVLGLAVLASVLTSPSSRLSAVLWTLFWGFAAAIYLTLHLRAWTRREAQDMRESQGHIYLHKTWAYSGGEFLFWDTFFRSLSHLELKESEAGQPSWLILKVLWSPGALGVATNLALASMGRPGAPNESAILLRVPVPEGHLQEAHAIIRAMASATNRTAEAAPF